MMISSHSFFREGCMRWSAVLVCLLLLGPAGLVARATSDDVATRLKALEERLRALEAELAALKAAPGTPPAPAAAAGGAAAGPGGGAGGGGGPGRCAGRACGATAGLWRGEPNVEDSQSGYRRHRQLRRGRGPQPGESVALALLAGKRGIAPGH